MQNKLLLALALVFLLLFASSCGSDEKQTSIHSSTPTPTVEPAPIIEVKPTESQEPPEAVSSEAPLDDGFVVPTSDVRPVAVMIDNQGDRPLPQGGIAQAQIVYEILTEYNITRYLAFFWGTMPEKIGPVRSSRHYFLDYALEYDAIYTHYGWSEYAMRDIPKLKVNNINFDSKDTFWELTKDKGNWQDTYTSKERLEKTIADYKYATKPKKEFPFTYSSSLFIPQGGSPAGDIFIKFSEKASSTCGYKYDEKTGLYARLRMGESHMERNSGAQVMVRNIIIAQIASPLIEGDKYGRINLSDIGSGSGWFITGGKAVKIKWKKDARDAQTVYTDESGDPIVLNRGQTWIEIVPTLQYVTIQ